MTQPVSAKFVISGGFGAGKTTFVTSVSEIKPLRTEGSMTERSLGVDDASVLPDKTTTTVAMDFGRLTVDEDLMLYLFGTPGQDRFGFMWNDICDGALGAIVLVDSRRLDDCYPALDFFEENEIPFVMALNVFDPDVDHDISEIRFALDIDESVPMIHCDARDTNSVQGVMVELCQHVLTRLAQRKADATEAAALV